MATMGFKKQKEWKLNMILILTSTRIKNVQWHEFKWGFKIKLWVWSRSLKPLIERVREKIDRASSLIEFFKTLTKNIFECAHEYGHPNKIKNYIRTTYTMKRELDTVLIFLSPNFINFREMKMWAWKKIWPHFLGLYQCPLFTLKNCYCATHL